MASLISILREVHDPRDVNARHDLASVLFLALAATLCGAKSCVEMAEFSDGNVDELSAMVPLPHGAPSHDTFSRVFRLLDPAELARAFAAFMAALREELGLGPARGVVAVDAKSLRRGYEKGRAHMPPLMVSVWDTQTRLSIAQGRAPGNGEVNATLALIKGLVLKGCTVTADALHGHAEMARTVRARKAHYCLGLKGNRGPLHGAVEAAFAKAGEKAGEDAPFHETTESRHGRQERRRASVLPATALEATHAFRASSRSAASRRAGPATAPPPRRPATSCSRAASARASSSTPSGRIGRSRTTCTGPSTSSSTKTTPARARTTPRKTSPSSDASPSTSSTPTSTNDPPPAK